MPRRHQRNIEAVRYESAEDSDIAGTGDVQHVRLEVANDLFRAIEVAHESQIKFVLAVEGESQRTARQFDASDGIVVNNPLAIVAPMQNQKRKPMPPGIGFKLPGGVGNPVDFQVSVREIRDSARLLTHERYLLCLEDIPSRQFYPASSSVFSSCCPRLKANCRARFTGSASPMRNKPKMAGTNFGGPS